MSHGVEPSTIAIPQEALDDLRDRLARTRWPDAETVDDWSQGVPLATMRALCEHWRERYDWRRCEAALNSWNPKRAAIDGLGIHFLHVTSPEPHALPLVLTHGWPGSVLDYAGSIGPLTDPRAHGADPANAFHLVLPSLPGFGFSDKPTEPGWNLVRIARAWETLMETLGYGNRWGAAGYDWGGEVTLQIAAIRPAGLVGCHLAIGPVVSTLHERETATLEEQVVLDRRKRFAGDGSGYAAIQSTRPQTMGYGLVDSPAAQAAWVYEKLREWTDCDGDPEAVFGIDAMLDTISIYWLTRSGASSARLYWESMARMDRPRSVDVPTAFSMFPTDPAAAPRRWVDRVFSNVVHWSEPPRGGHFGPWEQPERYVADVRAGFKEMRR